MGRCKIDGDRFELLIRYDKKEKKSKAKRKYLLDLRNHYQHPNRDEFIPFR